MVQCRFDVYDSSTTLTQHWLNITCLLGIRKTEMAWLVMQDLGYYVDNACEFSLSKGLQNLGVDHLYEIYYSM